MPISNTVIETMKSRRSTRRFLDKAIDREQMDALLTAAVWAPSGGNNQSWLFTAVMNREVLARLNLLCREGFAVWTPDDDYPAKHAQREQVKNSGYSFCHNAPALIIASNKPGYENAMADCSLALQNIFLAAESIGLGSCYINQLHWLRDYAPLRDYLAELSIPREHTICSAAAVGYIAAASTAPARKAGTVNIVM